MKEQPNRVKNKSKKIKMTKEQHAIIFGPCTYTKKAGFRSQSRPEPGYLAGARAVTLARLRLHLDYLFNNSRKLYGT